MLLEQIINKETMSISMLLNSQRLSVILQFINVKIALFHLETTLRLFSQYPHHTCMLYCSNSLCWFKISIITLSVTRH